MKLLKPKLKKTDAAVLSILKEVTPKKPISPISNVNGKLLGGASHLLPGPSRAALASQQLIRPTSSTGSMPANLTPPQNNVSQGQLNFVEPPQPKMPEKELLNTMITFNLHQDQPTEERGEDGQVLEFVPMCPGPPELQEMAAL